MTQRTERARIERVVEKESLLTDPLGLILPNKAVVTLIRRELAKRDARVRRIIHKKFYDLRPHEKGCILTDEVKAYRQACADILAALRGKGTR